jgi:hypothetical protein
MKWRNTELSMRKENSHLRLGSMFLMFFQLGIPISNQIFFLCAASISSRVGATNNCMQRLEAPSSSVERMLMPMWEPSPIILTRLQSPSYNLMRPRSERIPYLKPSTATRTTLVIKTIIELAKAVHKTICRFECQIRQLRMPLTW